jgi:hypothetical protein
MRRHRDLEALKDRQFTTAQDTRLRQAGERKLIFELHRAERRQIAQAHERDRPRQIEAHQRSFERAAQQQAREKERTQEHAQEQGRTLTLSR